MGGLWGLISGIIGFYWILWDYGVLYLGLWDSIGDNGIKGSYKCDYRVLWGDYGIIGSYIWDYRILWGDYGIMGSYIWDYRVLWDIMGLWDTEHYGMP